MFTVADRVIGAPDSPFIIAEVGINHNGSLQTALDMIDIAKECGADAVKFQTFRADELVGNASQPFTYSSQGRTVTESMHAMFARHELPATAWPIIKRRCDDIGILFFSTPQNRSDLDILLEAGVGLIKVGSDDFTNLPLLRSYAVGLPLILSCGMSTLAEAYTTLETVGAFDGYPVALLLCTSQYPTPPADVHMRKLQTLRGAFPGIPLGFSDHTQTALAAALAVAFGACIFEKHFTLDRNAAGPDHWFSEDPRSLQEWIDTIRTAVTMLGSPIVRPTPTEQRQIADFRRVLVASRPIAREEAFSADNLTMRREPAGRVTPAMFDFVVNGRARRDFKAGEPIDL